MHTSHARHGIPRAVAPVLLAAVLVVPFLGLELVTRRHYGESLPTVLFAFMAVHALAIGVAVTPALRRLLGTRTVRALRPSHAIGLVVGALLLLVYAQVIVDQWPCFVGVAVCD